MKLLSELFDIDNNTKVYSIHSDSRYVRNNSVFFCVEGLSVDGHRYVEDAIFQGAKCIVYSKPLHQYHPNIVYIQVDDTLDELNRVSNIFYDYPSKKLKVIGVTGTTGKTVVASMIQTVLSSYCKTGYIGTISVEYDGIKENTVYTTPETLFVQQKLAKMVSKKVKLVTMEASSHGLALKRIDGVDFDICIMTNITQEHLDFHGTVERYIASKRKLFEKLDSNAFVVLNHDDENYLTIKYATKGRIINYGIDTDSDVMANNIELHLDHTVFDLTFRNNTYHVDVPTIAIFNVYNVLALVGTFVAIGFDDTNIIEKIQSLEPVEGRMEVLKNTLDFTVIVDYCQSLANHENIFKFINETKRQGGKVIAVLGAPCKKDKQRRKKLGEVCDRYADHVILTEVDERGENIEDIAQEIAQSIQNASYVIISNREVAIEQAISMACKNDVVLLLGKGHEQFISLEVGQKEYPGDKQVALNAIEKIFGGEEDGIQ